MQGRPIQQMTLRELITESERLERELEEHLVQSFLPRAKNLERTVSSFAHPEERSQVPDSSVRSHTATVVESDSYTRQLFDALQKHLVAVADVAQRAAEG